MDLHPEENKRLEEDEIVSLFSEFLTGGIDTTTISLQWIIANLVKNPQIQDKLYREITSEQQVEQKDLQRMPYLKAVVLEGLRRHPPRHSVLPHTVSRDVELKDAMVNFMLVDTGWDPEVWEDPMEFRLERFVGGGGEAVDITAGKGNILGKHHLTLTRDLPSLITEAPPIVKSDTISPR